MEPSVKEGEEEAVKWVSRVGTDGRVSGAMSVTPPIIAPTSTIVNQTTIEPEATNARVRSTLLDGLPRKQISLEEHGGSVMQVAAIVGGVAINRYGQVVGRVAPDGMAKKDAEL